jgi:hypothetical protein
MPFSAEYRAYGTEAREVAAFAAAHAACPEPIVEVLPNGTPCIDRRAR